ncbi:hypothetical protein KKF91_01545 [Myxococcota bacterium]|nr:hypothetical protein [Myxococcota bacterium]
MSLRLRLLLAPLLLLFAFGCDGEEGGISNADFPKLEADPPQVIVPAIELGDEISRTLRLYNAGGAQLRITQIDLSNTLDTREWRLEFEALPVILNGGEGVNVTVYYSPVNPGTDSGEILVNSNNPDDPFKIPLRSEEADTELRWNPDRLVFNSEDSLPSTKSVSFTNLGAVPVSLGEAYLTDDTDAEFAIIDSTNTSATIGQGQTVEIAVIYTPEGFDRDEGTLIVPSNDPLNPRIYIPLVGEQPSGSIRVSPTSINFGAIDPDTESEIIEVVVENAGNAILQLDAIEFSLAAPGVNAQFVLHDLPAEMPARVETDSLLRFGISYKPQEMATHETALVLRSNDPREPTLLIPVKGRVRTRCVTQNPHRVDFGAIALTQTTAHLTLDLINCGDLPVRVSEITLEGHEGFHWSQVGGGEAQDVEIPPLSAHPLEVWFVNEALPERQLAEATLRIINDVPENPTLEIPLSALGGGAPSCNLIIRPDSVNMGLVSRGSIRGQTLDLLNTGTGRCEIRNQSVVTFPIPGLPSNFILTGPVGDPLIPPGAIVPVEVSFRPQTFFPEQAQLIIDYFDPFTTDPLQQNRQATAIITGMGGESNIEVIPGHLDFGQVTAGECASREERVTVYNTGLVDLCITDLRFEGDCEEFILVDYPVANDEGCISVTRHRPADVILVYEPGDMGVDQCELVFISNAQDDPEMRVMLSGEGVAERDQVDTFVQTSGQTVDVLFVIDNSGSMGEEQENLEDNFAEFISGATTFQNDYQIGIVTTDMDAEDEQGRLQGNPRILTRNPDVERQFSNNADVGTSGAGEEHGLEAAQKALADPLIFDSGNACAADADCTEPDLCVAGVCGGFNRGFLRDEAALELIFVSDEDDYSPGTLNFYVDFFKNLKGFRNDGLFHAHAIVGARNGSASACSGSGGEADAGQRYVEVSRRTNGRVFSICDDDFGAPLRDIGERAFGLPVQFFLSRPAERASVQVSVDGQPAEGWSYDQESNSVIFEEGAVPQPGQTIVVRYEAQCFPRRN